MSKAKEMNDFTDATQDAPKSKPGRRNRLSAVVLVGINVVLLVGAGVVFTGSGQKSNPTIDPTIEKVTENGREGGGMTARVVQPSPFIDMVHTLGELVVEGRLDERSAARLYAMTLSAGRIGLREGGNDRAVNAMVYTATQLLDDTAASVELSAFRQRQLRATSTATTDAQTTLKGTSEFAAYTMAMVEGGVGSEQWTQMPRLDAGTASADCTAQPDVTEPGLVAGNENLREDLLFYAGGKGTPGLAGMWLQLSGKLLQGSSAEVIADTLAGYAERWYDTTIALAQAEREVGPSSHPAAAAWLWYAMIGSTTDGEMKVSPRSDLLLETPATTTFRSAEALTRHAASVGLRNETDTQESYRQGASLGSCQSKKGN